MSKEDEINIIVPVGIIIGFIMLNVFNSQIVTGGRFILNIWRTLTCWMN
jgi:hypothetical protein